MKKSKSVNVVLHTNDLIKRLFDRNSKIMEKKI